MASAELKQIREALTKESIREHQLSKVGGTETDMFICSKCHGKNCTYTQVGKPGDHLRGIPNCFPVRFFQLGLGLIDRCRPAALMNPWRPLFCVTAVGTDGRWGSPISHLQCLWDLGKKFLNHVSQDQFKCSKGWCSTRRWQQRPALLSSSCSTFSFHSFILLFMSSALVFSTLLSIFCPPTPPSSIFFSFISSFLYLPLKSQTLYFPFDPPIYSLHLSPPY